MPNKTDKTDFNKVRTTFFFALIVLLGLAVLYVIRPFFYPIFWAAIIAIMFHSTYGLFLKHLRIPALSSIITLILVTAVIIIPTIALATLIINQSFILYQNVSQGDLLIQVKGAARWLEGTPLSPYLQDVRIYWNEHVQNIAQTVSFFLIDNLKSFTQNSLAFFGSFLLMLYALYFFLKDGPRMLKRLMHLSPLGDKYEQLLYQKFTSTARATLKGTVLMGILQGTVGGIIFWTTGIQGALIWGLIMAASSIVPVLGTSIIWMPVGVIMIALGNVWQGLAIIVAGLLFISTVDYLLRPKIVGRDIQMHPLLVLLSTLGGIMLFGISGIIIGPVIAAIFLAIISIYEGHYKSELNDN